MGWIKLFSLLLFLTVHHLNAQTSFFELKVSKDQQGQFVQEKHLKVLSQPFITKGQYSYQHDLGLTWRTLQPIESELNITTAGVQERQPDGQLKTLTNDSQFSSLLLALFSGEQQSLRNQFTIEQQQNTVILTPKAKQISDVISKIVLVIADTSIQQITLFEPSENLTKIFLTQSASAPAEE